MLYFSASLQKRLLFVSMTGHRIQSNSVMCAEHIKSKFGRGNLWPILGLKSDVFERNGPKSLMIRACYTTRL